MGAGGATQNREDDHDEIEKVPRLFEVVDAQGEDLESALGGENDNEERVEVLENGGQRRTRLVVVQRHGDHVKADEDHDHHIELLIADDGEDDGLRPPL